MENGMYNKKEGKKTTVILVLVFFAGLFLLLYPSVSNYWNSFHQSRAIAAYVEKVAQLDAETYERILSEAHMYNSKLLHNEYRYCMTPAEQAEYEGILDISGTGIMGYIEIPSINCDIPIYHGTSEGVLRVGAGHLQGSSLPVGGEGTHCVLSGHRGLPSARLFTDLDQLIEGDEFVIRVLNETLTYRIDQIRIVLPDEMDELEIVEGEDYCTLVTCTPYAVNTHRLLVRGRRAEDGTDAKNIFVTADATRIEPRLVAPVLALPVLLALFIRVCLPGRRRSGRR